VPGVKPVVIELTDFKTKEVIDELEVDACLVATGRAPYTNGLALSSINVHTDRRGFVPVNDKMQVGALGSAGFSLLALVMVWPRKVFGWGGAEGSCLQLELFQAAGLVAPSVKLAMHCCPDTMLLHGWLACVLGSW
jgi:hypothetical protein